MNRSFAAATLAVALATLAAPSAVSAAGSPPYDWPQLGGPERNGISAETGLLRLWPESGPEPLWTVPLGSGFSGVSAVGGRLYTLYGTRDDELLVALDAATGQELWRLRTDANRPDGMGDGPRSTPVVDGDRIYALSARGKLWAVEAASGKPAWSHDLARELGAREPTWGVSASPLVVGELLVLDVGGAPGNAVVAFEKTTGTVRWKAGDHLPGYSTPVLAPVGGIAQVVVFGGDQLLSLDPASGKVHWTLPWKTSYDVNAASPIFLPPDRLYVSSGYDTGAAMLRMTARDGQVSVSELWRSRRMKNQFSSAIAHQGTIYGFDNKVLKAIDAATGEERWRESGFGHGSLLLADGLLFVLSDKGELALIEATPEAYREKARARLAETRHWTAPTLWGGRLYVRDEHRLTCLRVVPLSSSP